MEVDIFNLVLLCVFNCVAHGVSVQLRADYLFYKRAAINADGPNAAVRVDYDFFPVRRAISTALL